MLHSQTVLALALSCAFPCAAQDATDFGAQFAKVERLMQQGKWPEARQRLLALLDDHRGRDHVLAVRDVVEACKRCTFHVGYTQPSIESLISGVVLAHD
jgi:hypothetical protein